jgi:hypothetical protein
MKIYYPCKHIEKLKDIVCLCHNVNIELYVTSRESDFLYSKVFNNEIEEVRKHYNFNIIGDKEIAIEKLKGDFFDCVILTTPNQFYELRKYNKQIPFLFTIAESASEYIDELKKINPNNLISPNKKILDYIKSPNGYIHKKYPIWNEFDKFKYDDDFESRDVFNTFIHDFKKRTPDAYANYMTIKKDKNVKLELYGKNSDNGVCYDLEKIKKSLGTLHIKYVGFICNSVIRSMCCGVPVIMDRKTYDIGFYDSLQGITVCEKLKDIPVLLKRIKESKDLFLKMSCDVYESAQRQYKYESTDGDMFLRFMEFCIGVK